MLRKHQIDTDQVIDQIISGAPIRDIYCQVTPGGGKSLIPIIAGKLITAGLADKLMWIAPRLSLTDQAEREFINPVFREMFKHSLNIRTSTNENNPCRGLSGFTTTYNAAGIDDGLLQHEFQRYRYILIMDEFHHIQDQSLWHQKIAPIYDLAAYRVMMTGTLERGDNTKIAFVPYKFHGKVSIPFLQDGPDTAVIRYTRTDALAERAIIPLTFHLSDASAEWSYRGKKTKVASIDKMPEKDAEKALYTVLKTEFADHLLDQGISHWKSHKINFPTSKCVVVTTNIEEAKRHIKTLQKKSLSLRCDIATSDDSESAVKAINKMKAGKLDVLVSVAMIYEGLSIPEISHLICLTQVRSTPWIEQMTARVNRIDPAYSYDEQIGHIFAPADPLFKQVMEKIEKEQAPVLRQRMSSFREKSEDSGSQTTLDGITPLSSALTGKREVLLKGRQKPVTRIPVTEQIQTSTEMEADLLGRIEDHIRSYAYQNRFNPKKINAEVFQHFGKKRRQMTIAELEACLSHVRATYPLSHIRGTGHPRVSTKATQLKAVWR